MTGWLTLFGSGETAAGMVKVHRALLRSLPDPARPVFVVTPAGFELGQDAIFRRFSEFFRLHLDAALARCEFRGAGDPPDIVAAALSAVSAANYILAGPGSPTYAAHNWRGSIVFAALVERWRAGAQIAFASAAAIALSRHVLPVYEIYKAGQPLHWVEGLDLLGPFGYELAIITHWDNAEGGTHDTRACFMGMDRLGQLRELLPASAVVLGIDEHTACTLDLERAHGQVRGRGGVTILRGASTLRHESGATFPLSDLTSARGGEAAIRAPSRRARAVRAQQGVPTDAGRIASPAGELVPGTGEPLPGYSQASAAIADGRLPEGLRLAACRASPELAALLHQAAQALESAPDPDAEIRPLLDLLIRIRLALRESQQWDLADQIRCGLQQLGIELQDTPEGTVWHRRSSAPPLCGGASGDEASPRVSPNGRTPS